MNANTFYNALKSKLDHLRSDTLTSLLARDNEYQQLFHKIDIEKQNYENLNLPSNQKNIIDQYLDSTDHYYTEYSTISYLAGLIDSQKLGLLFSTKPTATFANSEAIRNFYYNVFQPCAEPCETPETLALWKSIHEQECRLSALLTPEQIIELESLSAKKLEASGYSIADSFVYGFQLGTKILSTLLN